MSIIGRINDKVSSFNDKIIAKRMDRMRDVADKKYTKQSDEQTNKNIAELAMRKAKKNYFETTGKKMTPSRLKSDYEGMVLPKETRKYENDKAMETKLIRKRLRM